MADRAPIGLDDPVFHGRLRRIQAREDLIPRGSSQQSRPSTKYFNNNLLYRQPASQDINPMPENVASVSAPQQVPVSPKPAAVRPTPEPTQLALAKNANISQKHSRNRSQLALMSMAMIIFAVGIFVSLLTLKTNSDSRAHVAALAQLANEDAPPDETKPGDISGYKVAPNLPKYIKIPSLSVDARVKPMGVTSKNALQAPKNIYDAGWYSASAKPGDPGSNGAILIDGHVHGPTLPGVFSKIKTLSAGEEIAIQRGDDAVYTYKVVKVQNYDAKSLDLGIGLTSAQPGLPGLNLITCGGKFNQSSGQYDERTIVFAVLQS